MQWKMAWIAGIVLLGFLIPPVYSQDQYIDPELLDVKKIRAEEQLSDAYKIARLYVFLAVKKNTEYEAYVTKNFQDLDGDKKTVLEEPNDLAEFQMLTKFSNKLEIKENKHICYITALPHFDVMFPDVPNPFQSDGIVEVQTKTKENDVKRLEGSTTLPLLDTMTGDTVGVERYVAFYNKEVTKVELTKEVEENGQKVQVKTGEVQETIGPSVGSYGFIFMQLEESDN